MLTFVSLAPGPEGSIVQGFNFVIPSAAVTDFVKGTPVKVNAGSKFNDGLVRRPQRPVQGRTARARCATSRRPTALHPNLPDARRKLVEARER